MIDIDVGRILGNVRTMRAMLAENVKLCCVVKGDAYGCGDVRMSRVLEQYADVDLLAVAMLDEAVHLRRSGITLPILVLCDIADADAQQVLEYGLIPSIYRMEFLRRLDSLAQKHEPVAVHVRLDVCAGSPGMEPKEFLSILPEIRRMKNIRFAGLYTQLYGAYTEDEAEFNQQRARFDGVLAALPTDVRKTILVHAASTAAACQCKETHYDMVRIGAALYGLPYEEKPSPFLPVMTLHSRIISLKDVEGSVFTGYHASQQAGKRRLATVAGGYEDALFLMFVKHGQMLVHGCKAPIVGEACMDTTTLDVTNVPNVGLDDDVVLLGRQGEQEITIADIMQDSGFTMANCQLVFKTGRRTPKVYLHYPEKEEWKTMLRQVQAHNPTVNQAMRDGRGKTLAQYVAHLAAFSPMPPRTDRDDFADAIHQELAPILGDELAREAAALPTDCALTANHHGVDCFAQSVQGNILYLQLLRARGCAVEHIVPVLACGSVPLDNSSYGKGLMLFDTLDGHYPLRLPVIPNRFGGCMVRLFPGMTEEMVQKALEKADEGKFTAALSPSMHKTVTGVLRDYYGAKETLALPTYRAQACRINYELTKTAFGTGFAYVDLEGVASRLLQKDLCEEHSLTHQVLLDPSVRGAVLDKLDGATGCWDAHALQKGDLPHGGTVFFWAVGEKWTREPMQLDGETLVGCKTGVRVALDDAAQALREGRIYPALLLCFLPILFERGIRCFGGCFQPEYLRVMRDGLADAFLQAGKADTAQELQKRDPSGYLSGPMFRRVESGAPAGIVELLADPVDGKTLQSNINLDFLQAHRLALANLYTDVVPAEERIQNYTRFLA